MKKQKLVLLSFDTEEFDLPFEHGAQVSIDEGMAVSVAGTRAVLDVLERRGAAATFFCTATFASHAPSLMSRIVAAGHEVASHGVDHRCPRDGDATRSKEMLERQCGVPVCGYRQPRMQAVDNGELAAAGYSYNSSLHPTMIPGRYMHLDKPRLPHVEDGVLQIPVSVTPRLRLPVFWLACHHYPQWLYRRMCLRTLRHDGHFAIYFHPWEFVDLAAEPRWNIPWTISRHSGAAMLGRLDALIGAFMADGARFITYSQFTRLTTDEKESDDTAAGV